MDKRIAAISIVAAAIFLSLATSTAITQPLARAQTNATNQTTGNNTANPAPEQPKGFATVGVVQDENHIVITITKNGAPPEGPVVVIPPGPEGGKNGTILTPGENTTNGGQGNVTVIDQGGNVTTVENGNVTQANNSTVVVAPPSQNVTETPANVTIVDPPATNTTTQPCTCNQTNQTTKPTSGGGIEPVTIIPATGQNVTIQKAPTPTPLPPTPVGNVTTPTAGNQTSPPTPGPGPNEPLTPPATNNTNQTTTPPMVPNGTRTG